MSSQQKLSDIFRMVFDDATDVRPERTANDMMGGIHSPMSTSYAMEGKFNIQFSQKELLTSKNIGDLQNR